MLVEVKLIFGSTSQLQSQGQQVNLK